jgi:hypothetical protein
MRPKRFAHILSIPASLLGAATCLALAAGCASGASRPLPDGSTTDTGHHQRDSALFDASTGVDGAQIDGAQIDASHIDGSPVEPDAQECVGGCTNPPSQCYEPVGECIEGHCTYTPKPLGAPCDDNDPCTQDDECDGSGGCSGVGIDCTRPNAHGATCINGACQGWECDANWGDCNLDWSDGCEIPVGVADSCDLLTGINYATGCGTAYCGSSTDSDATNYGDWYCIACPHCDTPQPDYWRWCDVVDGTGTWFDAEPYSGGCPSSSDDLVCGP